MKCDKLLKTICATKNTNTGQFARILLMCMQIKSFLDLQSISCYISLHNFHFDSVTDVLRENVDKTLIVFYH
jgi:hypothetical protein